MNRARLLIPLLAGLLLGPVALRPAGTMAAEKKEGADETKTTEKKKKSKAAEPKKTTSRAGERRKKHQRQVQHPEGRDRSEVRSHQGGRGREGFQDDGGQA